MSAPTTLFCAAVCAGLVACAAPEPPARPAPTPMAATAGTSVPAAGAAVAYGTVREVERVEGGTASIVVGAPPGDVGAAPAEAAQRPAPAVPAVHGAASLRYTVDMDSGEHRRIDAPHDLGLRPGQRVQVSDGLLQPW